VFPVHSNRIDKVEVEREGAVRRAKLTYLRGRVGKGAMAVRDKARRTSVATPAPAAPPAAAPVAVAPAPAPEVKP
jgi:hypothetical protein